MSKRAVILAGGKGVRLQPYTIFLPKPLMPIGDYPILEIVIRQLASQGFSHVTMTVSHLAELVYAFFGDGRKWDIKIDYSFETEPLGTVGPLSLIKDLPENFLVMNGDVLTDLNYSSFHDYHVQNRYHMSISSCMREDPTDYGVLHINESDRLFAFEEKPVVQCDVSMGVYMFNKEILKYIPNGKAYGFDNLVIDLIRDKNYPFVKKFNGYWKDIGKPDDYAQVVEEFEKVKNGLLK